MRIFVRNDGAVSLGDFSYAEGKALLIQIVDPINVWFSNNKSDLDQVDNANVPQGGFMLTSFNPPDVRVIPFYKDKLFARSSQPGHIELIIFDAYGAPKQ